METNLKSFRFIRHGETDWNKDQIYQGQNDIPLNNTGLEQARVRAHNILLDETSQIFTSPLLRAKRTAEVINELNGNKLEIIEIPEFMECKSEESARYVLGLKGVQHMPSFEKVSDFIEAPTDFFKRVQKGLNQVWDIAHDNSPLIVAHGGVCAAFCMNLGIEFFSTPNCCLVEFNFEDGLFKTKVIN